MSPLKRISFFFFACVLIYALLVVPWPGLFPAYRYCFRACGNLIFNHFGANGLVTFEEADTGSKNPSDQVKDTTLVLGKRNARGVTGSLDLNSIHLGYRPTAFLVALVLATQLPWSRRGRALLWGLLWVNVFIAFRLWIKLLDVYSNGDPLALYALGPTIKSIVKGCALVLVAQPETHYMAPALVWVLVTFRRDNWRKAFGFQDAPAGPKPATKPPPKRP